MTQINYITVLEIAAKTLEEDSELTVKATDLKTYEGTIKLSDNSEIVIKGQTGKYSIGLAMKKKSIPEKRLQKWIDRLEYELEQSFLKNIKVSYRSNIDEYILEIDF